MSQSLMSVDEYVDDYFAITQGKSFGGDEGDSCHKTLHNCILKVLLFGSLDSTSSQRIYQFVPDGNLIRHPRRDKWVSDWDRGSGDQHHPLFLLWCLGYGGAVQSKMLLRHCGRLGFFTNTRRNGTTKKNHGRKYGERNGQPLRYNYNWKVPDWTKLYAIPVLFRSMGWPFIPIYWTFDLFIFLNTVYRNFKQDNDVANHINTVYVCSIVSPSPLSLLSLLFLNRSHMKKMVRSYFKMDPTDPEFLKEPFFLGSRFIDLLNSGGGKCSYKKNKLKGFWVRNVLRLKDFLRT